MGEILLINNPDECARLWRAHMPRQILTDLWEVRQCFQRHFKRPSLFIVYREKGRLQGLLPLSWIREAGCYGYFPGETWCNATWLEQNRFLVSDPGVWEKMLSAIPGPYRLRYLLPNPLVWQRPLAVDEVGYVFEPPLYGYDPEAFWGEFSGKHKKQVRREIEALEKRGMRERINHLPDLDLMVSMNLNRFGKESYFYDPRFQAAFRDLANWLHAKGMLRLVTVELGGEPAAVDMGGIYNQRLTVLAGGVDPSWSGLAKLMNVKHLEFACRERLEEVDFLCGNFNWKKLLHLGARPLYSLTGTPEAADLARGTVGARL